MKKPYVTESEDGSIWIEFTKDNKRFFITLENNLDESGWGYVSKENGDLDMECDSLEPRMLEYIKKFYNETTIS